MIFIKGINGRKYIKSIKGIKNKDDNNQRVAIGTTIKHIKQTITTPIIIFNLQFLQYIILYNSLAFWLNC